MRITIDHTDGEHKETYKLDLAKLYGIDCTKVDKLV